MPIAFDHFHISKYVGTGVDEVRREENRALKKLGILDLVGTKYDWLKNRAKQKKRFSLLKNSTRSGNERSVPDAVEV